MKKKQNLEKQISKTFKELINEIMYNEKRVLSKMDRKIE